MDHWQGSKYNVRHYIKSQHKETRRDMDELRLLIFGVSEQLQEFLINQQEAIERQRKIHDVVSTTARILVLCAVAAVAAYVSG